ncbi:FkbM family methyltransferase, partial [Desulfurivibrio sp. D14AmB]|uniref:FkbM family methyltransferase n=1 Tax=Desulfurivibrio sp. D14AmB TaxID=3374370 RepID=UPI00376ECC86
YHPIIRHAPTFSTPGELAKPLSGIEGVEVVEGELTDDEFLKLFARSDIVVLPYTPDAFALRTSGLLIDAMYFGIPCVVIRGTWLGNLTERFGNGAVVDELSATSLVAGVREVAADYESYRLRAREAGKKYFLNNSWSAFSRFLRGLDGSKCGSHDAEAAPLLGPNSREQKAHWDETYGIARLFQDTLSGTTMIDVGAHHGSALVPFLNRGWRIYAFEPDDKNRSNLLERLAKHKNKDFVSLDTRCVSNQPQKGVSFFTSKQSTGISGLSAFHESHVEAQKVDITTLTEFFQDKPMPAVDFLKIDTEGHDLFVLQGYPWERGEPAVIECEFEDVKTVPLGYTFHDLSRFLVDKGYTVYVSEWHPIIRYGIQHDWNRLVRYPCELADPKGWGNLLAFRDPIDEQALVTAIKKVLKVGGGKMSQNASAPLKPAAAGQSTATAPLSSCAMRSFRVVPGRHFAALAPNQWRYTHAEAKQKIWVATMDAPGSPVGRTFGGCLRVVADRAMTVNVSLGRQGKTEYEGTAKRITLAPGAARIVNLSKRFTQSHAALKLQLEVIDLPGGGSAVLTIDNLGINESLASIRDRQGAENLDLRTANRLFREGEYPTALGIYLWLSQQRPLPMYGDNAVMAARRSGMQWVKVPGDLAFLIV